MEELKLVKNLAFGELAKGQVLTGVTKLTNAVGSTLGASGKCVIIEDTNGKPQVTKDGVTFENWQVAHFRILGNDKHAPYGTSVLEASRRI